MGSSRSPREPHSPLNPVIYRASNLSKALIHSFLLRCLATYSFMTLQHIPRFLVRPSSLTSAEELSSGPSDRKSLIYILRSSRIWFGHSFVTLPQSLAFSDPPGLFDVG